MLSRVGNEIRTSYNTNLEDPDSAHLAKVAIRGGKFSIAPLDKSGSEKVWLVCRAFKPPLNAKGYRLAEGDVIKLGRIKLRVKEIRQGEPIDFDEDEKSEESEDSEDEGLSSQEPCRVCLSEVYEHSNPLLNVCNCAGTMKYIHLKCLQKYLKSKIYKRVTKNFISFEWQSLSCDLCKKPFPYKIKVDEQTIDMLSIPKPPGQYILFELLCTNNITSKGLCLVAVREDSKVVIGRGNTATLKISDVSVSRCHAFLHYERGAYFLEDAKSKFGTLVQVKRPIMVQDEPFTIQIGRSLLKCHVKQSWKFLPKCIRGENNSVEFNSMPVFPISSGVPLSVADPNFVLSRFASCDGEEKNFMHLHSQLGVNSSCEEEKENDENEEGIKTNRNRFSQSISYV